MIVTALKRKKEKDKVKKSLQFPTSIIIAEFMHTKKSLTSKRTQEDFLENKMTAEIKQSKNKKSILYFI